MNETVVLSVGVTLLTLAVIISAADIYVKAKYRKTK